MLRHPDFFRTFASKSAVADRLGCTENLENLKLMQFSYM